MAKKKRKTPLDRLRFLIGAGAVLMPGGRGTKASRQRGWQRADHSGHDALAHHAEGLNNLVRCDGLVMFDLDGKLTDPLEVSSVETLVEGGLPLDRTFQTSSPGWEGNTHFVFRAPEGLDVARVREFLRPFADMDVRSGSGQYFVAPGSVHPNGDVYGSDGNTLLVTDLPEAWIAGLPLSRAKTKGTASGCCTPENFRTILANLDPTTYGKGQHDRFVAFLAASKHIAEDPDDALEAVVEFLAEDGDYGRPEDEDAIRYRWDSFHRSEGATAGAGTIRHELKEAGRSDLMDLVTRADAADDFEDDLPVVAGPGAEPVPVEARGLRTQPARGERGPRAPDEIANALSAVARCGVGLAFDELKQRVVFTAPSLPWEGYGRTLDDNTARLLRLHLIQRHRGLDYQPSRENVWEAATTVAMRTRLNPVVDYLDALEWDGTARVDRLFGAYFDCGEDDYSRAVSRCFMVGAVRRQRSPGCKFDTMPVLVSREQGRLKSTGLNALFGADWFSDADLGSLKDKDAVLALQGVWVQEFAELDGMRRAEAGALKAFCSRAVDRVRPPYGRGIVDLPRRCVFVGTGNEGGYLKDATGGRRFWPLTVRDEVRLGEIAADRDQLWAEASALEASGEDLVLPRELWEAAAERQSDQTSEDPWADAIRHFLERRESEALDCKLEIGDYAPDNYLAGERSPPVDRVRPGPGRGQEGVQAEDVT